MWKQRIKPEQIGNPIKGKIVETFIKNRLEHTPDTNARVNLCLNVYHPPWLVTKERYTYTSLDWSSRSVREKYTYESHWIPSLRINISYLPGLSGPQPLDGYRVETENRLGANQSLRLTTNDEVFQKRKMFEFITTGKVRTEGNT